MADGTPVQEGNLRRDEARGRASRVSDIAYKLDLHLPAGSEHYAGYCEANFRARPGQAPVFVDFVSARIEELILNGNPLPTRLYDGTRIHLPEDRVAKGMNKLQVRYQNRYDTLGVGFTRLVDPADGAEYVHTNFEPHDAHRLFPCFDQPDLKATYTLRVTAPKDWQVVANALAEAIEDAGDEKVHRFPTTGRFSTYLMAVAAGPFAVWADPKARLPSRVLARQSLKQHVDADEIFEITRKGFDWFENYFGIRYPYAKYDQVFIPEFQTGAMENVGAIFINDLRYLFRSPPSRFDREERAMVILHELSHMWFGNLVTMRWWDGLWLNESFATYLSFHCLPDITGFDDRWTFFDERTRNWAMWQDDLPTTHPIENDVPETLGCFANFDGITYGKGCCALKQLVFRIGEEKFGRGVREYLRKFEGKNTENRDFTDALASVSGLDLTGWVQDWLFTSGINTVTPVVEEGEGRIAGLSLLQDPGNGSKRLRPHRVRVALFHEREGRLVMGRVATVSIEGARTPVPELVGEPAPAFVHPNLGMEGYFKVAFTPADEARVLAGLGRVEDPAVRSNLVDFLAQRVKDAGLATPAFLEALLAMLPDEDYPLLLEKVSKIVPPMLDTFVEGTTRHELGRRFHELATAKLEAATGVGPAEKFAWFRLYAAGAIFPGVHAILARALDGRHGFVGLDLDQDRRWELVTQLARTGAAGAPDRIRTEAGRDPSDRGRQRALLAEASLPDPAGKERTWMRFTADHGDSLELLKAGFPGFHRPEQGAVTQGYATRFLDLVPRLPETRSMVFATSFVLGVFPAYCTDPAFLTRVRAMIAPGAPTPAALKRPLAEKLDDLDRLMRIRAAAKATRPAFPPPAPETPDAIR